MRIFRLAWAAGPQVMREDGEAAKKNGLHTTIQLGEAQTFFFDNFRH